MLATGERTRNCRRNCCCTAAKDISASGKEETANGRDHFERMQLYLIVGGRNLTTGFTDRQKIRRKNTN
jgi:hypothetical protein